METAHTAIIMSDCITCSGKAKRDDILMRQAFSGIHKPSVQHFCFIVVGVISLLHVLRSAFVSVCNVCVSRLRITGRYGLFF